jgi:hypothetical protein
MEQRDAGYIPFGPSETAATSNDGGHADDWERMDCFGSGVDRGRAGRDNYFIVAADHYGRQIGQALGIAIRISLFNFEIGALDPPQLPHAATEVLDEWVCRH